ncbi:MAG: hypothetical protein A3H96_10605 [Acidobacteria bacterium RIFCSPLOWO2_02_FULL_67_36]|nr:MAG: hypothetical protein A3H96_10605 [Acidobacteria bacterium RIFCSPLOWO2_02_FULL_67_36]OFW24373.1 MAG: hypothetical protein A3G21_17565 [Acidobacteria bacterium RIFCSPLOWO2_12_FULL_66_21]
MRRLILLLLVLLPLTPARADALTIRDIVELSRAGLGDDVLLALIEVDRSVFNIDTATLKSLKEAGVSERVIVAIVRSGRTPPPVEQPAAPPVEPQAAPEPQVIVIDHHDAPEVREVVVPVAVPVYVPVVRRHVDRDRDVDDRRTTPTVDRRVPEHRPAPPVYWGGSLRPDAWQPTPPGRPIKK